MAQTHQLKVPVNHPASSVWQTYIKNFQVALPTIMPELYSAVEYLEGPPLAPGGVVLFKYNNGFNHYDYLKGKWEVMDHDNYYTKMKMFEGGALGTHFSSLAYSFELLPGSDPMSCIKVWTLYYEDIGKHDFHDVLKKELDICGKNLESYFTKS